jgi:predicted SprT family Zn-dependent metalloprotease
VRFLSFGGENGILRFSLILRPHRIPFLSSLEPVSGTPSPKYELSERTTAQLTLPGIDVRVAPVPFDPRELIQETFRSRVPEGTMPAIEVSRRMMRTLGSFTPSKNVIRLSARLIALGTPAEQEQVALHEVAHAIVHHRVPKASAHGRDFRTVCKELGLEPRRFVDINHSAWRERLRYAVKCPGCGDAILRQKRVRRVRCDCGVAVKPRTWAAVALTEAGVKPL